MFAGCHKQTPILKTPDVPSLTRATYEHQMRAGPSGVIPPGALLKAHDQRRNLEQTSQLQRPLRSRFLNIAQTRWMPLGPQPIPGGCVGYSGVACNFGIGPFPESGRVTSIAIDPSDPNGNTVYLGTAAGGVWKTTDGGQTWTPITDDQDSLHIGAITVDPTNPQVVYAGLGVQDESDDQFFGLGILKSTDGGASWRLLTDPAISNTNFGRLAIDPQHPDTVYAATDSGIARSDDGGVTWSLVAFGEASDVVIDSSVFFEPSVVYAAIEGVGVFSTNTSLPNTLANWKATSSLYSATATSTIKRIRLALYPQPPSILFALFTTSDERAPGLLLSANGGVGWTSGVNVVAGGSGGLCTGSPILSAPAFYCDSCASETQCNFDLDIAVSPIDPKTILVMALDAYLTTDGGYNWSNLTQSYSIPVSSSAHADQHAGVFFPGRSDAFYIGNDGGIYKSVDRGAHLIDLNQTLSATMFYAGATHPSELGTIIGGAQDTGVLSRSAAVANWRLGLGGDGGYVAVDFSNPSRAYATRLEDPFKGVHIADSWPSGDFSILSYSDGVDLSKGLFVPPLVIDPTLPLHLFIGTSQLFSNLFLPPSVCHYSDVQPNPVCANGWTPLKDFAPDKITAIAVAPSAGTTVYVGTLGGKLWISNDGGATATAGGTGLPSKTVRTIAVHPTIATTVWVGVAGFGFGSGHVWESTDGGITFTDISGGPQNGGIPDAPVSSIVVDPLSSAVLYAGGDVGVFRRTSPNTWASFNAGLPNAPVNQLVFHPSGAQLYAFTLGRGAFAAVPARLTSLLSWGQNVFGELGDGTLGINRVSPVTVLALDGAVQVAGHLHYSTALRPDGTVWTWGDNAVGELGDGTTNSRTTPAMVMGLPSSVIAIGQGASASHDLVVLSDNTVWGWGVNSRGELGGTAGTSNCPVGSGMCRVAPAAVPGLPKVVQVAVGGNHSLALTTTQTVWAWGDNTLGQSGGRGCPLTDSCPPTQVSGLSNVVAIAAGEVFSLALRSDGTVWAWGANDFGQLGNETTLLGVDGFPYSPVPIEVLGLAGTGSVLNNIVSIAAGKMYSLALRSDGIVVGWGSNSEGQLGDGTSLGGMQPRCVGAAACSGTGLLTNITAISAGGAHSLAVKSDGTAWAWGENAEGELGNGTFSSQLIPVAVADANGPIQAVTGISAGEGHSIVYMGPSLTASPSTVTLNGAVSVNWDNVAGPTSSDSIGLFPSGSAGPLIGNPFATGGAPDGHFTLTMPAGVNSGTYELRLYSGPFLRAVSNTITVVAAQLVAWGGNEFGQLGDGTNVNRSSPVPVQGFGGTMTTAGWRASFALQADKTVWAWGDNGWGQFGTPNPSASATPLQVPGISGVVNLATSATGGHTLAILSDGTVWAWGRDEQGQLGTLDSTTSCFGNLPCRASPAPVPGITNVVAVAAGLAHSLALKSDGTVWAWGWNLWGQVGTACSQSQCLQPVQVPGLTGVRAIGAGSTHSLALKFDGTVWAWGYNGSGQLGFDTSGSQSSCLGSSPPSSICSATPRQVQTISSSVVVPLTGISAISAGGNHNLALQKDIARDDGVVLAWGDNYYGQLGNGDNIARRLAGIVGFNTATGYGILTPVSAIAAGGAHSLALKSDGTVWAWGDNEQGQLGDGTITDRNAAVQVLGQNGTLRATSISAGEEHSQAYLH
jgi:alpha-tubulin suppressor-like RCC1 family protein